MATPNYQFEKRQRDIAKKKKQDEKRSKKLGKDESPEAPAGEDAPLAETTAATPSAAD